MGFLIVAIIILLIGIGIFILSEYLESYILIPFGVVILLISASMFIMYLTPKEDFIKKDLYKINQAEFSLYELQNNKNLSESTKNIYIINVKKANKLINDSKKYNNHWFLGEFYYDEVANIKKFELK